MEEFSFERSAVRWLYWDMRGGILPHPASAGTSRRADRDAPAAQAGALPLTEVHDETVVSDRYQLHYDLRTGEKQLARGWPTGRRVAVLRHRTCASSVLGVANYALAGYGTLQSFLLWKEKSSSGIDSRLVVYGFFDHHVERNVAPPEWLAVMALTAKHEESLASPFAYLDTGGGLAIGGPIQYPLWPLREHSALVNFRQHEYARLDGWHRRAQAGSGHDLVATAGQPWMRTEGYGHLAPGAVAREVMAVANPPKNLAAIRETRYPPS